MNNKIFRISWLLFIYIFCFFKIWAIDVKELENKSENELYSIAADYFKNRNDQEAFKVVKYLLENKNPKNKEALYILIEILIRNINNFPEDKKKDIYYQIIEKSNWITDNIDYYDYRAYYYKGWAFYNLGDLATAERNLKKSLENYSNYLPALYYLAKVYLDKNELENAQKIIERILKIQPDNLDFKKIYFSLLVKQNKFDEAISYFDSNLKNVSDENIYYLISLSYYNKSDFNKSLDYINKALNFNSNNLDYLKLKIKILFKMKKYKEAEEIINNNFKDTNDEEIKGIYSNIQAIKKQRIYIFIAILLSLLLISLGLYFYSKSFKEIKYKKDLQAQKNAYIEKVSKKAENLEVLTGFAYDFLSKLLQAPYIAIYIVDSKKDNTLYSYINNISDELPSIIYVYTKYSNWLNEEANKPASIYQIQDNNLIYEYFGGKNLINFKKEGVKVIIPAVSRGTLQALILIGIKSKDDEEKFFSNIKEKKDLLIDIIEEFANDVMSTRFKEAAILDELTRLYNRRYMLQKLEEEISKASQSKSKLSFILSDIDNFKKFNDTYGHQVGDEVLRVVAKVFKEASRADFDIPFRYGGEEIGLILPNTGSDKAFQIAERIRNTVSSKRFEGVPTIITISIGLATYPDHASDIESLIKEADEALYYSKKTGKNKTTIAGVKVLLNQTTEQQNKLKEENLSNDLSKSNEINKSNDLKKDFKLPSFCYSYEDFINYYNNLKSSISNIQLVTIESDIKNYEKILYEIHFHLLLTESITAKLVDSEKVEIKVLLVERSEKEVQDLLKAIEDKFKVKIS
ncbi:MAG: tetratricopeptide repeat-containing diguanylate cyclase [bacterium]|jgi:diguanylate cyclase (GGDEF)-like protein